MTDLSPDAQAVRHAYGDCIGGVDAVMGSEWRGLAAALRALADQVVPEEPEPIGMRPAGDMYSAREIKRGQRQNTRAEILAIAAELEGVNG